MREEVIIAVTQLLAQGKALKISDFSNIRLHFVSGLGSTDFLNGLADKRAVRLDAVAQLQKGGSPLGEKTIHEAPLAIRNASKVMKRLRPKGAEGKISFGTFKYRGIGRGRSRAA